MVSLGCFKQAPRRFHLNHDGNISIGFGSCRYLRSSPAQQSVFLVRRVLCARGRSAKKRGGEVSPKE